MVSSVSKLARRLPLSPMTVWPGAGQAGEGEHVEAGVAFVGLGSGQGKGNGETGGGGDEVERRLHK